MVVTLRSELADLVQRRVERGGLAAAGRAGADHHAERRADRAARTPLASRPACRARRSCEQRAASCRGRAARPSRPRSWPSSRRARRACARRPSISNCPSWERRRSTMFISAMILMRLTSACAIDAGRLHGVVQRAVDAEPHPQLRRPAARCARRRRVLAHRLGEDALERSGRPERSRRPPARRRPRRRWRRRPAGLEGGDDPVEAAQRVVRPVDGAFDVARRCEHEAHGSSRRRCAAPRPRHSASGPGTAITRRSSSARLTGSARVGRTSDSGTRTTASESGETRRRSTSSQVELLGQRVDELALADDPLLDEDLTEATSRSWSARATPAGSSRS